MIEARSKGIVRMRSRIYIMRNIQNIKHFPLNIFQMLVKLINCLKRIACVTSACAHKIFEYLQSKLRFKCKIFAQRNISKVCETTDWESLCQTVICFSPSIRFKFNQSLYTYVLHVA